MRVLWQTELISIWENTSVFGSSDQGQNSLSRTGVGFAEHFKWKVTPQPGWERTFSSGVLWICWAVRAAESVVAVRMPGEGRDVILGTVPISLLH